MGAIEIRLTEIVQEHEAGHLYRMVFEDIGGTFRIPVVISQFDARPLLAVTEGRHDRGGTHDLLARFLEKTGYTLNRIEITGMERGVYSARIVLDNFDRVLTLNSRPSDAVALALRYETPIFIDEAIVRKVGELVSSEWSELKVPHRLRIMQDRLEQLVREERYEEAVVLRDRIRRLQSLSGGADQNENVT